MVYPVALFLLTIIHAARAESNATLVQDSSAEHNTSSPGLRAGVIAAIIISSALLFTVVACLLRTIVLRYCACRRARRTLRAWPHTRALDVNPDEKYPDHTHSLHDTLDRLSTSSHASRAVVVDMTPGFLSDKANESPFFSVPVDLPRDGDYTVVREHNNRVVEMRKQASNGSLNASARASDDGCQQATARSDSPTVPPGLQSPSPPSYTSGVEGGDIKVRRSTSSRSRMPPAVEHVVKRPSVDDGQQPRTLRWQDQTLYRSPSARARMDLPQDFIPPSGPVRAPASPVMWATADPFASAGNSPVEVPRSPAAVDDLRKYLQSAESVQSQVWTEVKEQYSRNNSITEEWRDVPLDKPPQ
ncbi:hypothetical protein BD626DRAFT_505718 [Schizophyllum amplum]|uniref:Uncharacterized protein n=1 Tax=Schizophyllum amplum TaxID=97359 RepID=A0A550C5W1_9AGAR|nr:hypothetical protein BD626DRAFT_505718 [Auriculariopsis ampla]